LHQGVVTCYDVRHESTFYVDESGQDTEGAYFIVVVVISDHQSVSELEERLEKIEKETGKQKRKWTGTRFKEKTSYLTEILQIPQLERAIFYMSFYNTKDYTELTTLTLASAILKKTSEDYRAHIMVDGLNEKERSRISKRLSQRGIRKRKLRSVRDESSALLRLADTMAGFIRDYEDGKPYVQELYRRFLSRRIITKL